MAKRKTTLSLKLEFTGVKGDKGTVEIHTLNPGDRFPRFGGSKHDLVAGKTASIVQRSIGVGTTDLEIDIYNAEFWMWIAKLINGNISSKVVASVPDEI